MEDPHLPSGPEGSPILYYSGGSLPCQMARLALEEKGVEYRLRHVNLNSLEQLLTSHRATQLEPWFLKINGAATVPALVHAGKKLGSSGEICKYVAKLPGGPALTSADDDKFLKLCADVAHEDLVNAYLLKTGNTVAKVILTQVADGTLRHLKGVAEGEHTPGDVKNAAAVKVKTAQAKVAALADPAASYDKAYANFTTLLDALDKALDRPAPEAGAPHKLLNGTPEPCLADVAATCMLARAQWAAEPREAAAARPRIAAYWAAVQARPAFGRADVWTQLKPGAALALLGEAAVDGIVATYDTAAGCWGDHVAPPLDKAWHAVSDPINKHVIKPVADSPQFMAAHMAVKVGTDRAGAFLHEKVVTPVKHGSDVAGAWMSDRAEETKVAAGKAMDATKAAVDHAAEATKHAAEHAAEATKHAASAAADATKRAAEAAAEHAKHAADAAKAAADKVTAGSSPKAPAEGDKAPADAPKRDDKPAEKAAEPKREEPKQKETTAEVVVEAVASVAEAAK